METTKFKTETVKTVAEYTVLIESALRSIREANSDDILLFRGQPVDEPLLPKVARLHNIRRKWDIPQRRSLHENELHMLDEFKLRSRPFLSTTPENEWNWLALAQHHGMETRLLDWTFNPMVALYFALAEADSSQPVVWIAMTTPSHILTPLEDADPFDLKRTTFFRPNLISPRIIAQDGWFSMHKYVARNDSFIPLEKNKSFRQYLTKITIHGKPLEHLAQLHLCGGHRAALFPDLDGVAKYINWRCVIDNWIHIRMPQRRSEKKKESRTSD